jgi:hypothetical protein
MRKFSAVTKIALLALCAVSLIGVSDVDAKKWYLGVGTGFTFLNAEGTEGFNTVAFGPIQADFSLDPSDFQDYMETGLGIGGYATDGTWMIQGQFGYLKLGGEPSGSLPAGVGGGTFTTDLAYEILVGQFTVGYTAYRSKDMKFSVTPYAGVRYTKHKTSADLVITQGAIDTALSRSIDDNWVDALIGSSFGYAISPKVSWSFGGDVGFGGSNSTFTGKTDLSWKPLTWMSVGPNFSYSVIDYENGEKGDSDWYIYDADEWGAGIGVLFHF